MRIQCEYGIYAISNEPSIIVLECFYPIPRRPWVRAFYRSAWKFSTENAHAHPTQMKILWINLIKSKCHGIWTEFFYPGKITWLFRIQPKHFRTLSGLLPSTFVCVPWSLVICKWLFFTLVISQFWCSNKDMSKKFLNPKLCFWVVFEAFLGLFYEKRLIIN